MGGVAYSCWPFPVRPCSMPASGTLHHVMRTKLYEHARILVHKHMYPGMNQVFLVFLGCRADTLVRQVNIIDSCAIASNGREFRCPQPPHDCSVLGGRCLGAEQSTSNATQLSSEQLRTVQGLADTLSTIPTTTPEEFDGSSPLGPSVVPSASPPVVDNIAPILVMLPTTDVRFA